MNGLEIHELLSYGKAVRQGTIKLHDAVKQIHQKYNDVAEKSAEYPMMLGTF